MFHDALSMSSSRPSSTAASAISPFAAGLPSLSATSIAHARGLAHLEHVALGRDFDVERVVAAADLDLGHAELVGGLGEIDERGRPCIALDRHVVDEPEPVADLVDAALQPRVRARHFGIDAAAQRERGDEDVRAVAAERSALRSTGDLRVELDDLLPEHAFALDRDEHGRLAERHAHLEVRGLARLVALLLGDQIDAVVVGGLEPPFVVAAHPYARGRVRFAAAVVFRARDEDELARRSRLHRAEHEAARVGRAGAARRRRAWFRSSVSYA